jgi:3-isopropylmalate dehydrogenase
MTETFRIAVLGGDGIGPEVMKEGVRVLRALSPEIPAVHFELNEYSVGAGEYLRSGNPLPDDTFAAIADHDAILLGAMGLPGVRWPDGREMTPQIDLREKLDLYLGLRPIRLYHPKDSPLRTPGDIDFVLVRESTEGLFSSRNEALSLSADFATDKLLLTRKGCERLFHRSFALARQRRGVVHLVDKANVLPSMSYFRHIFFEVARHYSDVRAEAVYVDAMSLYLVQRPDRYDVMVTENLFGDILSDLAAGIIGGMGMAPSADIGDRHAVFQPSHGTAPDIAGKGIANPIAMILSVAMMLDWMPQAEAKAAGKRLHDAVAATLANPEDRTRDLGGSLSTTAMTDLVLAKLAQKPNESAP